jgi:hypothetical protein
LIFCWSAAALVVAAFCRFVVTAVAVAADSLQAQELLAKRLTQ